MSQEMDAILVVSRWWLDKWDDDWNFIYAWYCFELWEAWWSERSGFEPWPGHCVVFFAKKIKTLTVPLSAQVYKRVPANYWGKANKLRGTDLTSIPSRGSRNTTSRFILQKPGISIGVSEDLVGSKASIFFFYWIAKRWVRYRWNSLVRQWIFLESHS